MSLKSVSTVSVFLLLAASLLTAPTRAFAQNQSPMNPPTTVVPADPSVFRESSSIESPKGAIIPEPTHVHRPQFQAPSSSTSSSESSSGLSDRAASFLKIDENNSYSDQFQMREERKIGFGGSLGGDAGMLGLRAEYNFDEAQSGMGALGFGPGYQAFSFSYKYSWYGFLDTELSPYLAAGYSHWSYRGAGEWSGSDVLRQALNEEQKNSRRFGVDFIPVTAGLQYFILEGEAAGLSFFGELNLLNQIQPTRQMILSGALGATFYF